MNKLRIIYKQFAVGVALLFVPFQDQNALRVSHGKERTA